jgi:predicted ester cyclase
MGATENERLVREMFDRAINKRDLSAIDEFIAPKYVNYDMPTPEPGPAGMKALLGGFFEAFPDMSIVIEQTVADGDLVCTRGYFEGTQTGDFMGVPPTGNKVNVKYIDMWRVVDRQGTENWVRLDMLGLMQQLGVVPAP